MKISTNDSTKKLVETSILLNPKYVEQWFVVKGRPFITYALILTNVIAYVLVCIALKTFGFEFDSQQLILAGANWSGATLNGQYWRLLTACFLHAGWFHLVSNMFVLLWVGNVSERLFGHSRTLIIYCLTGLASSVCSILYSFASAEVVAVVLRQDPPMHVAVGASGAIMGLIGAYFSSLWVHKQDFPENLFTEFRGEAIKLVILTIVLGIPMQADQGAHIGGLLCGFAMGYFMLPRTVDNSGLQKADFVASLVTLAVCALLFGITWTKILDIQHITIVGDGMYKVMTKDYPGAIAIAKREIEQHPQNRMAVELLAMAYYQDSQYEKALVECRKSLAMGVPTGKDYLIEADYCHRLHLYHDSIKALKKAVELDQSIKDTDTKIVHALFMEAFAQGDFRKSTTYGKEQFVLSSPPDKKAYAALYYTVAARLGHIENAENLMARCSELKFKDKWTNSVLAYENKSIDAAELLKRATDADKQTEAHAYIGFDRLSEGDSDGAKTHLDWVARNGDKDFVEYDLVQLTLTRLKL